MFYVGQQVVCIDASVNPKFGPNSLVESAVYTIHRIILFGDLPPGIELVEVETSSPLGFHSKRFRPVTDRPANLTSKKVRILEDA
jgi:hypothetical protein